MSLRNKLSRASKLKLKEVIETDIKEKRLKNNPIGLAREFYAVPCKELAESLLGKLLLRKINGITLKGRIVEVEMYPGGEDKASHTYKGRRTPANEPMYMTPGTAYVYKTYGIYHCFNISALEEGGAVLIRAMEPLDYLEQMRNFRSARKKTPTKEEDLCKGPSNLCTCMHITKETCNKLDMAESDELWLEKDGTSDKGFTIVRTSRVGIDSAGVEWASKPYRFYIKDNVYVSKRNLKAEAECDI